MEIGYNLFQQIKLFQQVKPLPQNLFKQDDGTAVTTEFLERQEQSLKMKHDRHQLKIDKSRQRIAIQKKNNDLDIKERVQRMEADKEQIKKNAEQAKANMQQMKANMAMMQTVLAVLGHGNQVKTNVRSQKKSPNKKKITKK